MWAGNLLFLMIISRLSLKGFSKPFYAAHIIGIRVEAAHVSAGGRLGTCGGDDDPGRRLGAGDAQRA